MKQFFLTLLFCSILSQCFALVPMTDDNIQQAIQYGVASRQDKQALSAFLNPWKLTERTLKNPYREKETIVLYTPYLLAAIHARDKVEESRVPELKDIKALVKEYDGITLIGARLNAPVVLKEGEYTATLVQGKTNLAPYAYNFLSWEMMDIIDKDAPVETKPTGDIMRPDKAQPPKMKKVAVLDYQFYFDSSQFDSGRLFTIVITDKYCGERRFDVDPASIR